MVWVVRAGVFLAAGFTAAAFGQGTGGPPRVVLQALDTDHDGKLSAAEIANAPRALLTLDLNGDGQLTPDEIQPRPQNAGASADELVKQMMSFDRNGDGVLTPEELPARMQSMFTRGDVNHDGKLTADEIRAMAARQGMPAGTRVEPGHAGLNMRLDPVLNVLDANHDGVISADEIAGASRALLTLDVNGDHELTSDEMRVRQQTPAERTDHMLEEYDTNRDGRISKAEAPDRMQAQFESIDGNGDGFLDRDELMRYFALAGAKQQGSGMQSGAPVAAPKEGKQ